MFDPPPSSSPAPGSAPRARRWLQGLLLALGALLAGGMLWAISLVAQEQQRKGQEKDAARQQWVADRERCAGLTAEEQALSDCVLELNPRTVPVKDVRLPG